MSDFVSRLLARERGADDAVIQPRLPSLYEDWSGDALEDDDSAEAAPAARLPRSPVAADPMPEHAEPLMSRLEHRQPPSAVPDAPLRRLEAAQEAESRTATPLPVEPASHQERVIERRDTVTAIQTVMAPDAPPVDPVVSLPPAPGAEPLPAADLDRPRGMAPPEPVRPALDAVSPLSIEHVTQQVERREGAASVVKVSIGRIHVQLPPPASTPRPAAPKAPRKAAFRPTMNLSDYMNRRRK